MESTLSIYELKLAFIRNQVRILSENLSLPEDWQQYAVETEEGELSTKAIEDVLHKGMANISFVLAWILAVPCLAL